MASAAVSTITTSSDAKPSNVWIEARDKYLRDNDLDANEKAELQDSSMEAVKSQIENLDRTNKAESKSRKVAERLRPLITALQTFGPALDIFTQMDTHGILTLVWGGLKVVLALAAKFTTFFEQVINFLADIAGPLGRLEKYASLFKQYPRLTDSIGKVYAEYLECMHIIRQCLTKSGSGGGIRKKVSKLKFWLDVTSFQKQLDSLDASCIKAEQEAYLAGAQAAQERGQAQTGFQDDSRKFFKDSYHDRKLLVGRVTVVEDLLHEQQEEKRIRADEEEREAMKNWLSPLEFLARQKDLHATCFKAGGRWLLDENIAFRKWSDGQPWHLRCYGDQGSGKTVLSALAVHHLQERFRGEEKPVVCLYLEHGASEHQTMTHLFGSLLKQMIQLKDSYHVSSQLRKIYYDSKKVDAKPALDEVYNALQEELERYERTYIVVDGLDECSTGDQMTLVKYLKRLHPAKTSLMITSRSISGDIRAIPIKCDRCQADDIKVYFRCKDCNDFDVCVSCKDQGRTCLVESHVLAEPYERVEIDIVTPAIDIERYVNHEIGAELGDEASAPRDERSHSQPLDTSIFQYLCLEDPKLIKRIPRAVVRMANGRFLFAKLYMDSLKAMPTTRHINRALKSFPDELGGIYQKAMTRLAEQEAPEHRKLAYRVLALLVRAQRPLHLAEMQDALEVEEFGAQFDDGDDTDEDTEKEDNVADQQSQPTRQPAYSKKAILMSTQGLVTIDRYEATVRTVHSTLNEYLGDHQQTLFPGTDREIAEACLTYLNAVSFSRPCSNEELLEKKKQYPFLSYASQYWGDHVRMAGPNAALQEATLKVVRNIPQLNDWISAAWVTDTRGRGSWDVREGLSSLRACAWYGISWAMTALEREGQNVDVKEQTYGQTPLMYACRKGHRDAVERLLDMKASAGVISKRGRTAMFEAIEANQAEIVELLLAKDHVNLDINTRHRKEHDRTALMLAANSGYIKIVQLLLQHPKLQVNLQDTNGATALALASRKGAYEVVRRLLQTPDIDVNLVSFATGRSPLILAAMENQDGIIELLLKSHARSDLPDSQGGTAMLRAIDLGHRRALEKLISLRVDVHCKDKEGRTLIHGASINDHPELIRLLANRGLDVDVPDTNGLTPLHDASRNGHVKVAQTLLDLNANQSLQDKFKRTPFDVAALYGHTSVTALLDSAYDNRVADPSIAPLWSLATRNLESAVSAALSSSCLSPSPRLTALEPGTSNTALHCAVRSPSTIILTLLLTCPLLSPNTPDHLLRTPLHLAALTGNLPATTVLLTSPTISLNALDRWSHTPLYLAYSNKHIPIALSLICAGAAITPNIDAQALFFEAVDRGEIKAVERLAREGDADTRERNIRGLRAVQIAEDRGDREMVVMLERCEDLLRRKNCSEETESIDVEDVREALTLDGNEEMESAVVEDVREALAA